jgi:hypothetical protein
MPSDFVVHIGGGAYLEADGNLTFGPPTNAQVYQPPGGFRLDTKKVQDALKDLTSLLPQSDDDKAKWLKWGVPQGVVNFLSKAAGIIAPMSTFLAIYTWAIGAVLSLINAITGEEGMSPELANALTGIKNQVQGLEEITRANDMIDLHSKFDGKVDRMGTLLLRLVVENPSGATRAGVFADMRAVVDDLADPLSALRDQEWAVTYDADAYKGRGFASGLLVFEKSDGTLAPVPMVSPTVTTFDYRLGVPMLIYGSTTYAALAQAAMPWFRSAGSYAGVLRKTADAIDRFVLRMQDECLARTQYTAKMVFQQQSWSIFEIPMGGGQREMWQWDYAPYAVGAFDLVRYNDTFLSEQWAAQVVAAQETGIRGLFNYHWYKPSGLSGGDFDEIAAAANEQSRSDYASLQVISGAFQLIRTAAWLRFLSTPPLSSQTVTGRTNDLRIPRG